MHEAQGWLLNTKTAWFVLGVFGAAVLSHALWRSRGDAAPDPIRESGPII